MEVLLEHNEIPRSLFLFTFFFTFFIQFHRLMGRLGEMSIFSPKITRDMVFRVSIYDFDVRSLLVVLFLYLQ